MPSIIEGFAYDIFISYRHKDNVYDGWVTDFVDHLHKELEATLKEDVSIYFDENPHDGILETHNVEPSLGDKLKSVIFIPILSQTYCDPKCFAWRKEFTVFKALATHDHIGLDVRLRNGNSAGRILPVKIHDLDHEDEMLVRSEFGGHLRCVEFIYKEVGVNRPLRANEENPTRNLNQTYYRNQVNKVANAVKEILFSLQAKGLPIDLTHTVSPKYDSLPPAKRIPFPRASAVLGVLLALLVLSSLFWTQLDLRSGPSSEPKKSVAVLPLELLSGDDDRKYVAAGIHDALISELGKISGLRVISKTSSLRYPQSRMLIQDIARELGVDAVVEGSMSLEGNEMNIRLQLIDAFPEETTIWSKDFQDDVSNINILQNDIVEHIASEIGITLTPGERRYFQKDTRVDPEAYKAYLKGVFHWDKHTRGDFDMAMGYFEQARAKDPTYPFAYLGIGSVWGGRVQAGLIPASEGFPKAKVAYHKALELDSTVAAYTSLAATSCWADWNYPEAKQFYEKALEINPNDSKAHAYYSHVLLILKTPPDRALEHSKTAVSLDPHNALYKALYGMALNFSRRYDDAITVLNENLRSSPGDAISLAALRTSYHLKKMHEKSMEAFIASYKEKGDNTAALILAEADREGGYEFALNRLANAMVIRSDTAYITPWQIATLFARAGNPKETLVWLEKAYYAHDPNMPYIGVDPIFDFVRNEPTFLTIIRKMKLPV